MRVKVGDRWYSCVRGQPLMIELTTKDKKNIRDMLHTVMKYAAFAEDEKMTASQKLNWMHTE